MSGPIVDPERSVCLCDVGAPGYILATTITTQGEVTLWLAVTELLGVSGSVTPGDTKPAHERLGPLPRPVRDAIWGDLLRCGHQTGRGKPCRHRVSTPGEVCGTHAKPPKPRCDGCGHVMMNQGGVWGCFGCHPERHWTPVETPS